MIVSLFALLALAAGASAWFGPQPGDASLRRLTAATTVDLVLVGGLVAALAFAPVPSGVWYTLLMAALALVFVAAMAVPFAVVHWLRRRRPRS